MMAFVGKAGPRRPTCRPKMEVRLRSELSPEAATVRKSAVPQELRPIAIGENMERVVRAARTEGADFFKGMPDIRRGGPEAMLKENTRWIERRISEGRAILNLGEDAPRPYRSPFSKMEKDALREAIENPR